MQTSVSIRWLLGASSREVQGPGDHIALGVSSCVLVMLVAVVAVWTIWYATIRAHAYLRVFEFCLVLCAAYVDRF